MRLFLGFVLAFVLGLAPGAALAGWEATEWGMTPEQAQAAMPDLKPVKFGEKMDVGQVKSAGPFMLEGVKGKAELYYGPAGLERVGVKLPAQSCKVVGDAILRQRGKPLVVSDQVLFFLFIWHDEPRQTRIRQMFSPQAGICSVYFERLSTYRDGDLQGAAAKP
ncbi:hypothetical protein DDF62_01125 [Caulobacter radicis]|uniref:hypothetical protein n=1 Tax=Caulobacter radicis TaxID=2172650 RepID=UPI000D581056|nr:hypothetical protein [Caulobacter radicis]PVM93187.1 hypothetical protein DDF62_01125 [Caulobacter radicis]